MNERDKLSTVTTAQLKALDQFLTQTHRLYGVLDEMTSHPMLTEEEQKHVEAMFSHANQLDNSVYDRLQTAKKRNGIDEEEDVPRIEVTSDE